MVDEVARVTCSVQPDIVVKHIHHPLKLEQECIWVFVQLCPIFDDMQSTFESRAFDCLIDEVSDFWLSVKCLVKLDVHAVGCFIAEIHLRMLSI